MTRMTRHDLTVAQKLALTRFEPCQPRKPFPDINPRTATALWSIGLLKGDLIDGDRVYVLTTDGELARQAIMRASDKRIIR